MQLTVGTKKWPFSWENAPQIPLAFNYFLGMILTVSAGPIAFMDEGYLEVHTSPFLLTWCLPVVQFSAVDLHFRWLGLGCTSALILSSQVLSWTCSQGPSCQRHLVLQCFKHDDDFTIPSQSCQLYQKKYYHFYYTLLLT